MGQAAKRLIRLSKSCIGPAEQAAVLKVLEREYLGMGEEVERFEADLTNFFGRPAVCVVNGTAALHLSLQSCKLSPGDEVLVPSLTYVASFQAIRAAGGVPVVCDVEEKDCLLSIEDATKRLSKRTKAIMPVHYTGCADNLSAVYQFAHANGLRVVEDAAHAFGSLHSGSKIGAFGDMACFSFDGIKNITSGEGGCVVTDDIGVIQQIKDARLLGVENDTERRFSGERSWHFDVKSQGWRYHMSNIMAAIGREQLKRFPEFSERRQYLGNYYDSLLADKTGISGLARNYHEVVPHIYVIRIKNLKHRSELQKDLLRFGIQTGVHYYPGHRLTFVGNFTGHPLSVTDRLFPELLTLPLHPELQEADLEYIVDVLVKCIPIVNG